MHEGQGERVGIGPNRHEVTDLQIQPLEVVGVIVRAEEEKTIPAASVMEN